MELLKKIYEAGVVGAGGAGFPAHKKLDCSVDCLIINGAECEPLLMTDQYLMRNKGDQLIAAAVLAGEITRASRVILALKRKYVSEARSLIEAVRKANAKVELFYMDGVYPAGDEHVLVYEVTGRIVEPGGIPLSVGTVVSNINTMYNIYEAVNNKPVVSRYVTVTGEVKKPVLIKAPLGTAVGECIAAAGGTCLKNYRAIMGGPMMGKLIGEEQLRDRYITKTDSGIILIPGEHYLSNRAAMPMEHIINQAKSACIQCSYCTDLCPRYLLGHRLRPHRIMRAISMSEDNDTVYNEAFLCSECGICELYACPMGLSPRKVNVHIKERLRNSGAKLKNTSMSLSNSTARDFRKIPMERLISRIDMSKYDMHFDDTVLELHPEKVCIPLKQHIGVPAAPVVSTGETVAEGQLIAAVDYKQTGANIHASIDGIVEEVSSTCISIKSLG